MKYLIFLFLLVGCGETTENHNNSDNYYNTYLIDGCEYVGTKLRNSAVLTHKGNCKNPIHENTTNKEGR